MLVKGARKVNSVTASAPGKVILAGEHFVVKGEPAVALAVNLRVYVTVKEGRENITIKSNYLKNKVTLSLYNLGNTKSKIGKVVATILKSLTKDGDIPPLDIVINSEIPPRYGMGSSAALSVALIKALSEYLGLKLNREEVNEIAYKAEEVVHGTPSGIDNTVSTYGGIIVFRRGEGFIRLNADTSSVGLVAAYSGTFKDTKELVIRAKTLSDKYPRVFDPLYHAAGRLALEVAKALKEGNFHAVGELMNVNQGLLSTLGVSSLQLERLVYRFREVGAFGAKLTGAGGGGCVIALVPKEALNRVMEAVRPYTNWVKELKVSYEGVRLEVSRG